MQNWFDSHYNDGGWKKVFGEGIRFLRAYSAFMLIGSVWALIWANLSHESYEGLKHVTLLTTSWVGEHHDGHRLVTVHYLVTDILMAPFFMLAFKEVWEAAVTKNGSLHDPRKAAVPLISTLGGVAGPAIIYVLITLMLGRVEAITGWAIPTATDIAFSYVIGRIIFGPDHTAIKFLLLLAIADDALGLVILAIFYPTSELQLQWLLLSAASMAFGYWGLQKYFRVHSFWPYFIIVGGCSLFAFILAGIHPVLGLIPVVVTLPHAETDLGLYMETELHRHDTLNEMEHWWKAPVEIILVLFALLNAGVRVTDIGVMTIPVVVALLVGKPLGIYLFGAVAAKFFGLPDGMDYRDLLVLGCVAGIGFTVALFVTTVALPAGPLQDAAKVGALLSFLSAAVAIFLAKRLGVTNGASQQLDESSLTTQYE